MTRYTSGHVAGDRRDRAGVPHGGRGGGRFHDSGRPRDAGRKGKPVPPEVTHAEQYYYVKQMNAKTPVEVFLIDGEIISGWIEWYDRDCIKVHRHDDPNLLVFKRHIKYIRKDPAADTE